jgi:hypothetical protein
MLPNPLVVETNAYTNVDVFDELPRIFVPVLIHEQSLFVNRVKYFVVEESYDVKEPPTKKLLDASEYILLTELLNP